ncbi:uncharacterized protein GO595_001355 [Histomonas meleagridis]|uniref:uncharacterized protein n=1 Tax=Histomonas meleagridis TaxID=135588 RepID=UPI00355967A1|nr:hypothetical protein GO595_001355 [Histomonas meleagridis]
MGLGNIFGGIRKLIQGGGRLVKNVIDKGKQIWGKLSPIINKGGKIISKIPGAIQTIRGKKQQMTDKIDQIVDMVPDGKLKDKIKGAVDRGKQVTDRVINKAQEISDKTQPYITAGKNIYNKSSQAKPAVVQKPPDQINMSGVRLL